MTTFPDPVRAPVAAPSPAPGALDLAESLCMERRYTDALVIGQSLLTAPAASDHELARIHLLVAQCLLALGERRLAARHQGLAGSGRADDFPLRRSNDGAPAAAPAVRAERCFLFDASLPAYWPGERRRRR